MYSEQCTYTCLYYLLGMYPIQGPPQRGAPRWCTVHSVHTPACFNFQGCIISRVTVHCTPACFTFQGCTISRVLHREVQVVGVHSTVYKHLLVLSSRGVSYPESSLDWCRSLVYTLQCTYVFSIIQGCIKSRVLLRQVHIVDVHCTPTFIDVQCTLYIHLLVRPSRGVSYPGSSLDRCTSLVYLVHLHLLMYSVQCKYTCLYFLLGLYPIQGPPQRGEPRQCTVLSVHLLVLPSKGVPYPGSSLERCTLLVYTVNLFYYLYFIGVNCTVYIHLLVLTSMGVSYPW